ncbi:GNAT family N-acetyltransferase [Streptomyces harbinensis]|uniref:GNAT family N-acetyltransferase n=1 Tax=Streptomyces harbinensis TaxID=1176198 RepID=UPI0034DFB5D4
MSTALFTRTDDRLGRFTVRAVDPATDTPLLHHWLTHPKSAFWLMQNTTQDEVRRYFEAIAAAPAHHAYLGLHDGNPAFLAERYDPAAEAVGEVYPVREGDVGMHFLTAPTDTPLHGFTLAVITTVMELLFADPATHRVVVEPDARNHPVHALNTAVGFEVAATVELPGKAALLSFCTRDQYTAATLRQHTATTD